MQVTNLRNLEAYIYARLVLPLKNLNAPQLDISSPISGKSGSSWELSLTQPSITQRFRRNYQRRQAERSRNYFIQLDTGNERVIVGEYDIKTRMVKLYENIFREHSAVILAGKIYDLYVQDSQLSKVMMENRVEKQYKPGPNDNFSSFDIRPRQSGYSETIPSMRYNVDEFYDYDDD